MNEESDGILGTLLYLKFGFENRIKEAVSKNKFEYMFEFEGMEYTLSEGLIEIRDIQKEIDIIIDELIELKNEEIEIEELDENELDIDSEVDVTDEVLKEIEDLDKLEE